MDQLPEDNLMMAVADLKPAAGDISRMESWVPLVTDWEYFTHNCIHNGLGPHAYRNIPLLKNAQIIPSWTLEQCKKVYYRTLSRNMILYSHFRDVVRAFSQAGIPVVALKGIFLADAVYGDIGLRQLSDIDLLVDRDDAEHCKKLILGLGFRQDESTSFYNSVLIKKILPPRTPKHLHPFIRQGVSVEIHTRIHNVNEIYEVNIRDYLKRAQPVIIHGIPCLSLTPEDLIQHVCLHLHEHFLRGQMKLFRFCDVTTILKRFETEIDWSTLERWCNEYNCLQQVALILSLSHKYFNAPVPNAFLQLPDRSKLIRTEQRLLAAIRGMPVVAGTKEVSIERLTYDIQGLEHLHGLRREWKIILEILFPRLSFMKKRYRIRSSGAIPFYYGVRIFRAMLLLARIQVKGIRRWLWGSNATVRL